MIAQTDRRYSLADTLTAAPWKFSSSMPQWPHWYTLRNRWDSNERFDETVASIRRFGYDKFFYRKQYRYWDCNGFHYWSMGAPVHETELINRAEKKYTTVYDDIANVYDSLYSDEESMAESAEVVEMAGDLTGNVLDVGCGTGLLFEFGKGIGTAGNYVGIDISSKMLDEFRRKFMGSGIPGTLMKCSFEDYWGHGFDNIVALFGAANYIPQEHLERIPSMLAPGGQAFLMFYQPDYFPIAYKQTGAQRPAHADYIPADGDVPYHKYMIRRIRAS